MAQSSLPTVVRWGISQVWQSSEFFDAPTLPVFRDLLVKRLIRFALFFDYKFINLWGDLRFYFFGGCMQAFHLIYFNHYLSTFFRRAYVTVELIEDIPDSLVIPEQLYSGVLFNFYIFRLNSWLYVHAELFNPYKIISLKSLRFNYMFLYLFAWLNFLNKQDLLYISTLDHTGFKSTIRSRCNKIGSLLYKYSSLKFENFLTSLFAQFQSLHHLNSLVYSCMELYDYLRYRDEALKRIMLLNERAGYTSQTLMELLHNSEIEKSRPKYSVMSYTGITVRDSIISTLSADVSGIRRATLVRSLVHDHIKKINKSVIELDLLNKKNKKDFEIKLAEYNIGVAELYDTKMLYSDSDFPKYSSFVDLYDLIFTNVTDYNNVFSDLYNSASYLSKVSDTVVQPISYTKLMQLKKSRILLTSDVEYISLGTKLDSLYTEVLNWYLDLTWELPSNVFDLKDILLYNKNLWICSTQNLIISNSSIFKNLVAVNNNTVTISSLYYYYYLFAACYGIICSTNYNLRINRGLILKYITKRTKFVLRVVRFYRFGRVLCIYAYQRYLIFSL